MADENATIEEERMMQLEEARIADEEASAAAEEEETDETQGKPAKSAPDHFINGGEAALLLAFTGLVEIIQWAVDFLDVILIGILINGAITIFVGFILFIWVSGKVADGAPKSWFKAIYYGAVGGALPVIPGFLGAIIYLLIQDRKILGKVAGELGEKIARKI